MPTDAASTSVTFRPSGKVMVVNVDNPPVNALGVDVRRGLVSAIDAAESDDSVAAVLIVGAGRNFIAGVTYASDGKGIQIGTEGAPFLVCGICTGDHGFHAGHGACGG